MQRLNGAEIKNVSGGLTGPGQLFGPEQIGSATRFTTGLGLLGAAASAGWQAGTYINDNHISQDTSSAIGYTVDRLVNHTGDSIRDAVEYWL